MKKTEPYTTMPRSSRRIALVLGIAACFAFSVSNWDGARPTQAGAAQSRPRRKANIIRDIAYTKAADPKTTRRQTLDLYLPAKTALKPPLGVFIHGGYWTLSDDEYRIGPAFAEALVARGVAVALVRYRLAPAHTHPGQAQDVAAAVAYLARQAGKHGYDRKRIFLAGHSAGAHLAALVALDPNYLRTHQLNLQSLAGVIAVSGIYDLKPRPESTEDHKFAIQKTFGDDPDILKAASPIMRIRADAPPFLILTASSDLPGFLVDAKKFADALRGTGHPNVEPFIVPDVDHFSVMQLNSNGDLARSLILEFLKVEPLPPEIAILIEAKRKWRNPPFSTLPFWARKDLLRSYPIDQRFVQRLLPVYEDLRYELLEWPLENYYAIDLFSYLDSLPPEKVGRGDYLVITNIRNEKEFWHRRQVAPYQPVIVVGMDDERNLFRLGVFYRGLREYTWKAGPQPPMMARPLGAFIHFLKEPPPEWQRTPSHDALTIDSFQLVETDPLAPLSNLPKEIYEVVTHQNGCVYCHTFRGIGSRSHHNQASDGAPHGGLALPLESYPDHVWKAFVFNQQDVAAQIGASPNVVDEEARQALYELVVESRKKQDAPNK